MTHFTHKMLIAAPKPLKNTYDDSELFRFFYDLHTENIFSSIQQNKSVLNDCIHGLARPWRNKAESLINLVQLHA